MCVSSAPLPVQIDRFPGGLGGRATPSASDFLGRDGAWQLARGDLRSGVCLLSSGRIYGRAAEASRTPAGVSGLYLLMSALIDRRTFSTMPVCPSVAERDSAIKHRLAGGVIAAIGNKEAQSFEL